MKFILKTLFSLSILFLFSCKKENGIFTKKSGSELSGLTKVDLGKVFKKEDSQLPNRAVTVGQISQYYKKVWEGGDLWGGILVAKGDDVLFENYRGFAQPGMQQPIDKNTPMHVASVSKTLTAMLVLKLIEAKKLSLEDPVTKFFPQFPYPEVTVFTLLSQRSGLPKYEYFIEKINPKPDELNKKFLTNKDVLNLLITYRPALSRPTNTGFMYCNTNFALLALIVEHVTKTDFPTAMREVIFQPLKMKHSYIFQEKDTATAARSFYQRGPAVFPWDRLDLIYGDKNVYTTPRDLFNFSKAIYSEEFLKPELKAKIFEPYSNEKPGLNNYGLGFRMKVFDPSKKLTYHNGWWHGSNTVFAHLLNSKTTIIAIGNKYSNRVYSALTLSGLFEDFAPEKEKLNITVMGTDSTAAAHDYTE